MGKKKVWATITDPNSSIGKGIGSALDLASDYYSGDQVSDRQVRATITNDDDDGDDALPEWAIPAAIAGGVLLLLLLVKR